MEALLYFVIWAAAFFLMMRLGCGAHAMGHHHGSPEPRSQARNAELRWVPPEKDRDPVCGNMVATAKAKPSVYDGMVYYFCSRECREQFETAPHLYLTGGAAPAEGGKRIREAEGSRA